MKEEPQEWEGADEGAKGKGLNWGMILVGVVVGVAVLLVLSPFVIFRECKVSFRTEAISNAKQMGLALLEFDQEFGAFPNDKTAELVRKATGTKLDLTGTSSNAMFRQLIAFGIQSEDIFYCKHPEGVRKPDKDVSPGKALAAGEVGFSYLSGQNTKGEAECPVLAAPMKIGTEQFWSKPFGGKAVILHMDNSASAPVIREKDGMVPVEGGKTLFETGAGTVWGDEVVVDLRHPERGR